MVRSKLNSTLLALAAALCASGGPLSGDAAALGPPAPPIVGGHDAPAGKYPYVAALRKISVGNIHAFCTGTLINKRWVLTAAHCVDGEMLNTPIDVRLGEVDLEHPSPNGENIDVDSRIIHPGWGGDAGDRNDVALLHLERDALTVPARFGTPRDVLAGFERCKRTPSNPYALCVAGTGPFLGWGKTRDSNSTTSTKLMETQAAIFNRKRDGQFWVTKAGGCPGDSGGPLFAEGGTTRVGNTVTRDHRLYVIGVASFIQTTFHGGWCSRKGLDYFSDVSIGAGLYTWVQMKIAVQPSPGGGHSIPGCNETKPNCSPGDED